MFKLIKCTRCYGSKQIRIQHGYFSRYIKCPTCNGLGNEIQFKPLPTKLLDIIKYGVRQNG